MRRVDSWTEAITIVTALAEPFFERFLSSTLPFLPNISSYWEAQEGSRRKEKERTQLA